jgi:DNA-binding transcriptional MerR regulator
MKKADDEDAEDYSAISEVASSFGISAQTLRRYEWEGLIRAHRKGGSRVYSAEDINRIRTIRKLKSFGFSVQEMRAVLDRPGAGPFGLTQEQCAAQLAFLKKELVALQEVIAELERAAQGK